MSTSSDHAEMAQYQSMTDDTVVGGGEGSGLIGSSENNNISSDENNTTTSIATGRVGSSSTKGFTFFNAAFSEIALCVCFFLIIKMPSSGALTPYQRPIPYQQLQNGEYVLNLTNDQTYSGQDTVSTTVLFIVSVLVPILLQLALAYKYGVVGDVQGTLYVYLVGVGLTILVTELVKNYVGYLRPIFYDLCVPNGDYSACTDTETEQDARKSFPSGHASTAFSGLTLLTLFVHTRFGIPSIRRYKYSDAGGANAVGELVVTYTKSPHLYRLISVLSLVPLGVAVFIAASRVHDNKHFPADVVGGSVLGASISIFINSLWII